MVALAPNEGASTDGNNRKLREPHFQPRADPAGCHHREVCTERCGTSWGQWMVVSVSLVKRGNDGAVSDGVWHRATWVRCVV